MHRALRSALYAGLVAGTIDLAAAAAINGVGFGVILRAVASGLLGPAAFGGGTSVAVLGLILQWAMSIVIAGIYAMAAVRLQALIRRWIIAGVVYGVIVFFVMNYVVVPLSAIGHIPHFRSLSFVLNLLAMLLFGLIIASITNRFSLGAQTTRTGAVPGP
jgi:uncharacterized membrane protein (DUF485 family)